MGKCLVIVEVSQKQAYIFGSNKLQDNIVNSNQIAYVTSSKYFEECAGELFDENKTEVYCGGGHAVLQFEDHDLAARFIEAVTGDTKVRFPDLELFATAYECEGEPKPDDIKILTAKLEKKKAERRASFVQGSFGVEKVNSDTRDVSISKINGKEYEKYKPDDELDRKAYPVGYERAYNFEDLGGSKDDSNFIAVVHIDGNAMGKRVEALSDKCKLWADYRREQKKFSNAIDADFKGTFTEMCLVVADNISEDGKLGDIQLKLSKSEKYFFPIRRIITEGDDICFVTEGRIGLECARIFAELISKKTNTVDGQNYAVGAGVAIVHQKYPFSQAYELAEQLCSNAKKYIANSTKEFKEDEVGAFNVCAVDWHIEFGELGDDISDIRRRYNTADDKRLELRPYVLCGPDSYMEKEKNRQYKKFRQVMEILNGKDNNHAEVEGKYARGKVKNLRNYLRKGETAAHNYIEANRMSEIVQKCYLGIYEDYNFEKMLSGEGQNKKLFIPTTDGQERCILFDAVEMMDTFLFLKGPDSENDGGDR